MEILFQTSKSAKLFSSLNELRRRFGDKNAKKIQLRMGALESAETLSDYRKYDLRCHELSADRAGQIAVDLVHPSRLVFEPKPPVSCKPDGGYDWDRITSIIIIEVVDYH